MLAVKFQPETLQVDWERPRRFEGRRPTDPRLGQYTLAFALSM